MRKVMNGVELAWPLLIALFITAGAPNRSLADGDDAGKNPSERLQGLGWHRYSRLDAFSIHHLPLRERLSPRERSLLVRPRGNYSPWR